MLRITLIAVCIRILGSVSPAKHSHLSQKVLYVTIFCVRFHERVSKFKDTFRNIFNCCKKLLTIQSCVDSNTSRNSIIWEIPPSRTCAPNKGTMSALNHRTNCAVSSFQRSFAIQVCILHLRFFVARLKLIPPPDKKHSTPLHNICNCILVPIVRILLMPEIYSRLRRPQIINSRVAFRTNEHGGDRGKLAAQYFQKRARTWRPHSAVFSSRITLITQTNCGSSKHYSLRTARKSAGPLFCSYETVVLMCHVSKCTQIKESFSIFVSFLSPRRKIWPTLRF